MKIFLFSFSLMAFASLFSFCKHTKYTPTSLPDKQLQWGNGGGFTGKETTYTLLENGQIFKRDGAGALLVELEGTKKKNAKTLFSTAETLGLNKLDFMHPGNTYSFIEAPGAENGRRITWGDTRMPPDAKVQDFYGQLQALVKAK